MMDEFYLDVYMNLFIAWIMTNKAEYAKNHIHCYISKVDKYHTAISFETNKCYGHVSLWHDESNIVEQEIFDNESDKLLFYLHFNLLGIAQFQHLFLEFYHALVKITHQVKKNIAICGTNGLTTSIFVDELLAVCKLQKIDYQLTSISLDKLIEQDFNYDAIYLAPQISHLEPKLIRLSKQKVPIYKIDPTVFATKDYQSILKAIKDNL